MTTTTNRPRTGRRKEAVARVRLLAGTGRITINDRTPIEHLRRETLAKHALHALTVTNTVGKFDIVARVHGGGISGQAGAGRSGEKPRGAPPRRPDAGDGGGPPLSPRRILERPGRAFQGA